MTTKVGLTLEEFLKLPETKPAREYECGEVIKKTMPTGGHAVIQSLLGLLFLQFLRVHPLGQVGSEWRCVFGPQGPRRRSYVPDFVFIRAQRLPADGSWYNNPFHGAPDIAVEILSPNDRPKRVLRKVLFYLNNGVRIVWLVDPEDRTVTVYTPEDLNGIELHENDTLDGGDVLPGFSSPVSELFPARAAQ
jgi:Uma2 family endonuclease